jgi:hypothetical protein
VETPTDADIPGKPLTLVAQLPELPHLEVAQRRPPAEENGHALVAILPRIAKLIFIEHCEVLRKVLDHLGRNLSAAPCASAVRNVGRPLAESPQHFRILADKLRMTCIGTSLPPPSAQWP